MLDLVDRVRAHYADGCFACGRANPLGLAIDGFEVHHDTVRASFVPKADHRGLASRLHGGLTATALDEIMVWAGILLEGVLSVTGTLELRYRQPVPTDTELHLVGRVENRRGRRLTLSGDLSDGDDTFATASGLYLVTETVEELLG